MQNMPTLAQSRQLGILLWKMLINILSSPLCPHVFWNNYGINLRPSITCSQNYIHISNKTMASNVNVIKQLIINSSVRTLLFTLLNIDDSIMASSLIKRQRNIQISSIRPIVPQTLDKLDSFNNSQHQLCLHSDIALFCNAISYSFRLVR